MKETLNNKKSETLRKLNQESNQITKECIKTALLSLMSTEIFDTITVTAIINKAGVSRGGFYRNYKSKEHVLQEICEELFRYIWGFFSKHDFYEDTKRWYRDLFQEISDHTEEYQLLVSAQAPKKIVFRIEEECLLKKIQKSEEAFDRYRALSIIKSLPEIILMWYKNGMRESPEEMAEILLKIFDVNS